MILDIGGQDDDDDDENDAAAFFFFGTCVVSAIPLFSDDDLR